MGLAEVVMYEARFGRHCSSHLELEMRLDDGGYVLQSGSPDSGGGVCAVWVFRVRI